MNERNWNHDWLFWEETDAFALVWNVPEQAERVTLPHDAMRERPARADSPNGGDCGYRDGGNYVYVKRFLAPQKWSGRTVRLRFDGVYCNALVYLNGQRIGGHAYGYSPFTVELHPALRIGEENELRVLVKNGAMPNARWYSGSGIYRDVRLFVGGLTVLEEDGLWTETLSADGESAAVAVSAKVINRNPIPVECELAVSLWDGERKAAEGSIPVVLEAARGDVLRTVIHVDNPMLWSAETPHCYVCRAELRQGMTVLDTAQTLCGLRTLALDARHGLRVNGVSVKLRGCALHHDNGVLGAAAFADWELRRVKKLKEAGFNAIRSAHNHAAPALLEACDRLGMYVMDEAFDLWSRPKKDCDYALFFEEQWRTDLAALVEQDRSHPSVIFYSVGNEIPEIGMAQGSVQARRMAQAVRELDDTRFILAAVNGVFACGDRMDEIMSDILAAQPEGAEGGNVNNFMAMMDRYMDDIVRHPIVSRRLELAGGSMDLLGYNYMTARYEEDAERYPNRVMVGSETYPPEIARNWALVSRLPALIGDFTWTGWEYLGEAGVGVPAYRWGEGGFGAKYPCQLAYCGDHDLIGTRRPASFYREIVFGRRTQPYPVVCNPAHRGEALIKTPWVISDGIPHWTWPGYEGQTVTVEIYGAGQETELLLNGKTVGTVACGAQTGYLAQVEIPYEPGELTAVSRDADGRELGRTTLRTAEEPEELCLTCETGRTGELVFVTAGWKDGQGRAVPEFSGTVTVTVEGGGVLAGLGSGDPKPLHNYTEPVTDAFRGAAMAVVRRTGREPVQITVTDSDGRRAEQIIN